MGACLSTAPVSDKNIKNQTNKPNAPSHIDRAFLDATADKLINGFIHFGGSNDMEKMSLFDVYIPRDILWIMSQYHLQNMVISQFTFCTLESGQEYILDELRLEQYSMLTTKPFDPKTGKGGILIIKCLGSVIIEKGASINMNGKGYPPSHYVIPIESDGKGEEKGKELFIMKENKITCESTNDYGLELGVGYKHIDKSEPLITGGYGGGAVYIDCQELHLNGGNIVCCGETGFTRNPGYGVSVSGNGGSIKILVTSTKSYIAKESKILSKGLSYNYAGKYGMIRIDCPITLQNQFQCVAVGNTEYNSYET